MNTEEIKNQTFSIFYNTWYLIGFPEEELKALSKELREKIDSSDIDYTYEKFGVLKIRLEGLSDNLLNILCRPEIIIKTEGYDEEGYLKEVSKNYKKVNKE